MKSHARTSTLLAFIGLVACRNRSAPSPAPVNTVEQTLQPKPSKPVETAQEKSCHDFVQGFYDWYFDRLNLDDKLGKASPTSNDVLRLRPDVLGPKLRKLLNADNHAQAKAEDIVGLDFDPFIYAQDWDGKYSVANVVVKGDNCKAYVWAMDMGASTEIVDPELLFQSGRWTFVNFHRSAANDPQDKDDLVTLLIRLRNERSSSRNKNTRQSNPDTGG